MNLISDIWSGRCGLAKTYWIFGVFLSMFFGVVISFVAPGSSLAKLAALVFLVYTLIIYVGIWRSASQYKGLKLWAILAKIAVLLPVSCLVIGLILAVVLK